MAPENLVLNNISAQLEMFLVVTNLFHLSKKYFSLRVFWRTAWRAVFDQQGWLNTGVFSELRLICFIYLLFSELERLSNLVGKPSENHPLHNSGLLSLDPVQDKTPLYSQLLQAYKWSNKVRVMCQKWLWLRERHVFLYCGNAEGEGELLFFCSRFSMGFQSWKFLNFPMSCCVVLKVWGLFVMLR